MGRSYIQKDRRPLAGKGKKLNYNSYKRNVDALGRVMLPKEVREVLGIKPGSTIYFEIVDDKVLFKCEAAEA